MPGRDQQQAAPAKVQGRAPPRARPGNGECEPPANVVVLVGNCPQRDIDDLGKTGWNRVMSTRELEVRYIRAQSRLE